MADKKVFNPKVLVIGELNMDLILDNVASFPELGKEKIASDFNLTMGSSSAIFAANLARLGTPTAFCGMVGKDDFGHMITEQLREFGVDTSHVTTSPQHKTGLTAIIRHNNDRAMVTYPGAMEHFGPDNFPENLFTNIRHLHISSIFMQPVIQENLLAIVNKAKKQGMTISLDTQWDPDERWDLDIPALLSKVDFFLPNEDEFLALSGSPTIEEGITKLQPHLTDGTIIIKQGTSGALYFTADEIQSIPGYHNKQPVDAVGAGDSFNAGLIHRYLQGDDIQDCIRFGHITGAVSTTSAGGTKAIKSFETVQNIAVNQFSITDVDDFTG
ncbi:sugar kinase [Aliifodinibius salicampi]|uniref:Sugar kinase n=1 Tax=Fodinibius salicampi TaxID=1920655 RepID=A0ABT3PZR7_9BACT|nr:sugar kinase [Fodinibius salicampi]MCW9713372.1 sugar kinase [Fodinibius salicampi]